MEENGNNEKMFRETLQIIDFLDRGDQLKDPFIRGKVEKALRGDSTSFHDYLQKHPDIIERAKTNILINSKLIEENPFWPPPHTAEEVAILSGPLKFGSYNPFNEIFGINPELLNLNVMVVGRARSGKSNLNLIALDQLLRLASSFNIIIVDLKKEYRCLLPKHTNLKIITFKNLRLNPLEVPEWEDPKDHIINVAEVFCKENYLLAFGKNMILSAIEYLYQQRGIFSGSKNYPTFQDLYNLINAQKGSRKVTEGKESLLGRLKTYTNYPETFCCKSFPFSTWRDNHLAIELENLTNEMYATITNLIVSSIYNYYHKMNLRGSRIRTLFVVDEAGVLFDAKRDRINQFGDSYINTLVRKGGEFGLGFWVTSQEPNTISQSIHSNSFLKFMFPLVEGHQLRNMAYSMDLNDQQISFAFKLPPQGTCVARYSYFPNPLLLDVPLFPEEKAVSDAFVKEKMKDFYEEITPKKEPVVEPEINQDIPKDAATLLGHIAKHPFDNFTTHRRTCNLTEHNVDKARVWLQKNGYLTMEQIITRKGKGAPPCYLVLQEKALNYLNIKQHLGKGSFKHQLYCHLIKNRLEKESWKAKVENSVYPSVKLIDVVAEKDNEVVGYEVTLHFDNLQKNIREDLEVINKLVIVVEKNNFGKAMDEVKKCKSALISNKHLEVKLIEIFF